MMNVSVALPRDTECTNVPRARRPRRSSPRTCRWRWSGRSGWKAAAADWAVLGYSTGGYCAAKLAMMYPYQFSAAVSMAGYYTAIKDNTTGNLYGGSTPSRTRTTWTGGWRTCRRRRSRSW